MKDLFPINLLTAPAKAFSGLASGKTAWGWPLGLFAAATASSALLCTLLPPQFTAEALEGMAVNRDLSFAFYFAVSLGGGLAFSACTAGLLSAAARFLAGGRLSLRLPAALLACASLGITSAFMHNAAGGQRNAGLAVATGALAFSTWAAASDRARFGALLKSLLAVSVFTLIAGLAGGLAALAGSVKVYTGIEYLAALLSLIWLGKAVAAVYQESTARAFSSAVLGLLGGMALLFLLYNLGFIPEDAFQALMLI
ncbi:MAG: hypothetical protein M0011_01670 [Elusimicrobia bacterium]|nr:hypothetical protein [Elusimicrobiota bacterium]